MDRNLIVARLRDVIDWNSFAASLVSQHDSGKMLSLRQLEAAERMLAKMAATASNKAAAAVVDLSRVHDMFAAATDNGMKRPRFRFRDLSLSLAPATSRNAGSVYVKASGEYAGKVTAGKFIPVAGVRNALSIAEGVAAVAADPLAAAVAYGRETGQCACCGRTLTDPESVARGVGPICAAHWGLL